jgi:tetratricopeptide (TPR) repeat protein
MTEHVSASMKPRVTLKWFVFAAVTAALAWRIIVINVSDYHMRTGAEDAAAALQWNATQPDALLAQGRELARQDPGLAIARLEQAARANVADGRAYALLGRLWESRGDGARADKAFEAAARLAPERTDVQAEVAAYWMRRGNLTRALEHLDIVLSTRNDLRPRLYPELLNLAEDPRSPPAYASLLRHPVVWWPDFFAYAAANAARLDTLRMLFQLQGHGANAAQETALRPYLARLQREGRWTEAYFVWLNNLPREQLATVDNLFNGGFEQPLSQLGFDWMSDPAGHILVETASTYGSTGKRALHLVFRGPRVSFRHFYQHTMLPPGNYTLRGRVRPESLDTAQGLEWTVSCLDQNVALEKSERFLGSDQWRHFAFQFQIPPAGCEVQGVRLALAGHAALDYEAKGDIWFDDLSIERLE